ncbi:MAG: hypothetical protein ACREA9_23395 [Pyrinomonadaceae bacterium]
MNKKTRRMQVIYFLVVAYITVLAAYQVGARLIAYADCPACFRNETPAAAAPDPQGGRQNYSVLVDLTAGDGRYRTALNLAMGAWNNGQSGQNMAPVGFTLAPPQVPDANGNFPPLPQVLLQLGGLGTNKKGEKICGRLQTIKTGNPPTNIEAYVITIPPEAANWSLQRIAEVIEHEIGHILGLDDVNQGCSSIMQQGSEDCKTSVHGTIEARDVDAAQKYTTDRANCDKDRGKENNADSDDGGDPCGGDPCCGDPCCGDPCCGDPCCGDPGCDEDCYLVCDTYCYGCEAWDPYDPDECFWWGECFTDCYEVCY